MAVADSSVTPGTVAPTVVVDSSVTGSATPTVVDSSVTSGNVAPGSLVLSRGDLMEMMGFGYWTLALFREGYP